MEESGFRNSAFTAKIEEKHHADFDIDYCSIMVYQGIMSVRDEVYQCQ